MFVFAPFSFTWINLVHFLYLLCTSYSRMQVFMLKNYYCTECMWFFCGMCIYTDKLVHYIAEYSRMAESHSVINQKLQHSISEQENLQKAIQELKVYVNSSRLYIFMSYSYSLLMLTCMFWFLGGFEEWTWELYGSEGDCGSSETGMDIRGLFLSFCLFNFSGLSCLITSNFLDMIFGFHYPSAHPLPPLEDTSMRLILYNIDVLTWKNYCD